MKLIDINITLIALGYPITPLEAIKMAEINPKDIQKNCKERQGNEPSNTSGK